MKNNKTDWETMKKPIEKPWKTINADTRHKANWETMKNSKTMRNQEKP